MGCGDGWGDWGDGEGCVSGCVVLWNYSWGQAPSDGGYAYWLPSYLLAFDPFWHY